MLRHRKRIAAVAGMLAVLTAVGMLALNPFANADPAGMAIDGENGRRVQRFTHPDNEAWWVEVAVDTQRGLQESTNSVYLSGVARVTKGPGALRVQVDSIRLGNGSQIVTDFYPSKFSSARDNTPAGCIDPPPPAGIYNYYADISQQTGCQPGPNRLNSADDYNPPASVVRGYSDWFGPIGCGTATVATRGFFAVRWANQDYSQFTLRTGDVEANLEC